MGLTDALFTGTSGLRSLGHGMSVLGDNISNLNTTAFKGARITFSDVMAQRINTASGSGQMGRGTSINALLPMMQQGSFESTSSPTDLAIAGNGFFMVKEPASNGNIFYTRDGQFIIDKQGYMVNPAGYNLQGWRIDEETGDITGAITDIKLERSSPPQATSNIDLITNLDAREPLETVLVNLEGDIDGENVIKIDSAVLHYDSDTSTNPILYKDSNSPMQFEFIDDNFNKKSIYIREISFDSYSLDGDNLASYTWKVEYSTDGTNWKTTTATNTDLIQINEPGFPTTIDLSAVEKRKGSDDNYGNTTESLFHKTGTRAQTTYINLRDINGIDNKLEVGLLYNKATQTWSYQVKDVKSGTILVGEENVTSTKTNVTLNTGEKFTISWQNITHISSKEDNLELSAPTGLIELQVPSLPDSMLRAWNRFDFEVKDKNGTLHYLEAWLKLGDNGWQYVIVEVPSQTAHNENTSTFTPLQLTSDGYSIRELSDSISGNILAMGINYNLPGGSEQKSISFYLANSDQQVHLDWSNLDDNPTSNDIYLFGSAIISNSDGTPMNLKLVDSVGTEHLVSFQVRYNDTTTSWQVSGTDTSSSWFNAVVDTSTGDTWFYIDSTFSVSSSSSSPHATVYISRDGISFDGHEYTGLQKTDNNAKIYLTYRDNFPTQEINSLLDAWNAKNETPISNTEYTYRTTLNIYDSLGIAHELTVYFDRTTEDNVYEFLVTVNPEEDQRDFVRDLENPLEELNRNVFEGTNIPPTPQYFYDPDNHTHTFVQSANSWLESKKGVLLYGRIQFDRQGNIINFKETYRLDPNTGKPVRLFKEDGTMEEAAEDGFPILGENGYPVIVADFLGLDLDNPDTAEMNKRDIQQIELNLGYYYKEGRWRQESVRTTQYATSSSTIFYDQNGFGPGYLESLSVNTDGVITGHYSNGRVIPLWMVALANFNAPEMLDKTGGNLFRETTESGAPITGKPGTNGLGTIAPNSLEQSNVDLGEQFVKMITIQRGFQADARTITVTDSMLEELLNLKR